MKKKILLIQFLLNIVPLFLYVTTTGYDDVGTMYMFSVSFIQLLTNVCVLLYFNQRFFSLPVMFIGLSYLFHFGHLPLTAFDIDFGSNVLYPLWYINQGVYYQSFVFTYLVQYMVTVGILIILMFMEKRERNSGVRILYKTDAQSNKIKYVGLIFICIGILPTIYIEYMKMSTFFSKGYLAIFDLNIRDFMYIIANCVNFGLMALMIGFTNEKWKGNVIFGIAVLFKVIQMTSGGRGEAIIYIIAFFFIWITYLHKMKLKDFIILAIVGVVFIVCINVIAGLRRMDFTFENFIMVLSSSLGIDVIVDFLSEFGSTFASVCFSVNSFPAAHGVTFGINYLLPIVYILPNIGGLNKAVVDLSIYTNHFDSFEQPIGGSYVGELYYSFNWGGILFALVLGLFIGFIAYNIVISYKQRNDFKYLLYIQTIPYILLWIRGYFGALYRGILWHGIFAILLWMWLNSSKVLQLKGKWRKSV